MAETTGEPERTRKRLLTLRVVNLNKNHDWLAPNLGRVMLNFQGTLAVYGLRLNR